MGGKYWICFDDEDDELEYAADEFSILRRSLASSNRPNKPQAKCKSCGNTGKDFLGRICGCQAGQKLRASSNRPTKPQAKCRGCGNTGKDFLGRICGCQASSNRRTLASSNRPTKPQAKCNLRQHRERLSRAYLRMPGRRKAPSLFEPSKSTQPVNY